ncbi:hypothetical protein BTS2_0748 [Bacillus sp. TS-2]|nr:hypothetical protein BTS2_0748 [Bacillus sp. TS-2]
MRKEKWLLLIFSTLLILVLFGFASPSVKAGVPYDSYTYNYWLDPVKSPHPFVPSQEWTGEDLGVGALNNPNDLFITNEGFIYIVDTDNHRVLIFDEHFEFHKELKEFNNGDSFNSPRGVFVTAENQIYVADTDHERIVVFNQNYDFERFISRPETHLITDTTSFRPTKLAIDEAGRIYTLAIGINSGIVEINPDGTFQGFMGATEVSVNPVTYLWRRYIATQEQKRRMELIIPTEYNNIYLDDEEFIYVTRGNISVSEYGTDVIRRLNPTGVNVLRDFGYGPPIGDYRARGEQQITRFNDITVTDFQVYSALDGNNGKIFSYDYDGNLLYVFGSNGNRFGNFRQAVALEQYQDKLLVLDSGKNSIITFEMTQYAKLVNEAISLHYEGLYDEVASKWEQVLKLNANSDLAYIGLGKAMIRNEEYKQAMHYLNLANDRENYTKAFTHYRRELIIENFATVMTILFVSLFILITIRFFWKLKKKWMLGEESKI